MIRSSCKPPDDPLHPQPDPRSSPAAVVALAAAVVALVGAAVSTSAVVAGLVGAAASHCR